MTDSEPSHVPSRGPRLTHDRIEVITRNICWTVDVNTVGSYFNQINTHRGSSVARRRVAEGGLMCLAGWRSPRWSAATPCLQPTRAHVMRITAPG
jgi:hypothetical protein